MKKLLTALLKIASVLIIIFLISAFLIWALVDINQYKAEITQLVEQETGLTLEMNGDLKLSILSGIKFDADDVKLFIKKELIADIKSLQLGVSPSSLYRGEPEINSLDLSARMLSIYRDKKGRFNFLAVDEQKSLSQAQSKESEKAKTEQAEKLSIHTLLLKNINLSIDNFQYLDDLSAVSIKLTNSKVSLSQLAIIDQYELVIDDPRVLLDYFITAELEVKKALINQYQITSLETRFSNKKGDITADNITFGFIEEGSKHSAPPVIFDAHGRLVVKLHYPEPEEGSDIDWTQPEHLHIGEFDFNFPKFNAADKQYKITAQQTHLVFDEMHIFEANKYLLNELLIKSLVVDSKTISVTPANNSGEHYDCNQVQVQLNNVPLLHKGKPPELMSTAFLSTFAKKGGVQLSCDNLRYKSQRIDNISIALKGNSRQIDLLPMSINLMGSSLAAEGSYHLPTKNNPAQWQLKLQSDKLNLTTVAELTNSPIAIEGFSSMDTHLSGSYQDSRWQISNGTINNQANNILLTGININKILDDFQNSQSVGLLDVGAVVLMGPTGMLLTKGNDYNKLLNTLDGKGSSKINQLSLNMTFTDDILSMNDVAFATPKHRLAVKGKFNNKQQTFMDFKVATIDKQGCPIFEEQVKGTLAKPKVEKVNVLVSSIVNPISSLVKKVTKPLKMSCSEVFYSGVVKAP